MEFEHQMCAKGGIIGYPPYQHIHYLILGSYLLDNPTNPLDSRKYTILQLVDSLMT